MTDLAEVLRELGIGDQVDDTDESGTFDIYGNVKWRDQDDYLNVIARYGTGDLEFNGEDSTMWRTVLTGGEAIEADAVVTYPALDNVQLGVMPNDWAQYQPGSDDGPVTDNKPGN